MKSQLTMALLLLSTAAQASPTRLSAKGGESVRVQVGSQHEPGFGVRPSRDNHWRLSFDRTDADSAEVVDVTRGALGAKWEVPMAEGALRLDADRFIAGHAYRVELRRGQRTLGGALVYLYAGRPETRQQIQFNEEDVAEREMATLPKPTL